MTFFSKRQNGNLPFFFVFIGFFLFFQWFTLNYGSSKGYSLNVRNFLPQNRD